MELSEGLKLHMFACANWPCAGLSKKIHVEILKLQKKRLKWDEEFGADNTRHPALTQLVITATEKLDAAIVSFDSIRRTSHAVCTL